MAHQRNRHCTWPWRSLKQNKGQYNIQKCLQMKVYICLVLPLTIVWYGFRWDSQRVVAHFSWNKKSQMSQICYSIRIITHLLMQPWDLDAGRRSAWCSTTAIYKNWIANHKSQPNLISSAPFWHCIFCHPSDFEQNGMQCREKRKAPKDISVASNPFPENPWKRDRAHTLGQRHENLQCDTNNQLIPA